MLQAGLSEPASIVNLCPLRLAALPEPASLQPLPFPSLCDSGQATSERQLLTKAAVGRLYLG